MASKILIETERETCVHFSWAITDQTLCGVDQLGDPTIGIQVGVGTSQKVDCPDCIAIVQFCKSVKSTEIQKEQ